MTSTETIIHITAKNNKMPGPSEYDQPALFGKSAPKYTISSKNEPQESKEKAPEYQMLQPTIGQGHKYSLHGRPRDLKQDPTPGPNYVPPAFGKGSPSSVFHGKHNPKENLEKQTPGPGNYVIPSTIGSSGKKFTMKGRVFPPEEGAPSGPGPSHYEPRFEATMPKVQTNSIHLRTEAIKQKDTGPGPGMYAIPSTLKKTAPCFHGRIQQKIDYSSPGPAAHYAEKPIGSESRKCVMRPRIELKQEVLSVPYQDYKPTFGNEGMKSTFHGRTAMAKPEVTPGPNYLPPTFGTGSSKFSFVSRRDISQRSKSAQAPGPGQYDIGSTIGKGPKYSLKGRESLPQDKSEVPGPAEYSPDYSKIMATRKSEIGRRLSEKTEVLAGKYVLLPEANNGPKFTIGRRDSLAVAPGAK